MNLYPARNDYRKWRSLPIAICNMTCFMKYRIQKNRLFCQSSRIIRIRAFCACNTEQFGIRHVMVALLPSWWPSMLVPDLPQLYIFDMLFQDVFYQLKWAWSFRLKWFLKTMHSIVPNLPCRLENPPSLHHETLYQALTNLHRIRTPGSRSHKQWSRGLSYPFL